MYVSQVYAADGGKTRRQQHDNEDGKHVSYDVMDTALRCDLLYEIINKQQTRSSVYRGSAVDYDSKGKDYDSKGYLDLIIVFGEYLRTTRKGRLLNFVFKAPNSPVTHIFSLLYQSMSRSVFNKERS